MTSQDRLIRLWRQGVRHARHPIHSILEIRRILIVKPSALGDVVHALPLLGILRHNFPETVITWLVHSEFASVLDANPMLDEVIEWDRGNWQTRRQAWESLRSFWEFLKAMELGGFDLVIDLQGLFRSGLMTYATGAPVRVGFSNARELAHKFYNVTVDVPSVPVHAVDRYLLIADYLHLKRIPVAFTIIVDEEARSNAQACFAHVRREGRPLVLVSPVSRWPSKEWLPEGFARTARTLIDQRHAEIVLTGSTRERPRTERIRALLEGHALNLAGQTTLAELIALIAEADLFLTNDSGPMHIADALGTPLVAVFGPTDPVRTGPYRQRRHVIHDGKLTCSPCLKRYCSRVRCMEAVQPETVSDLAMKVLDGQA